MIGSYEGLKKGRLVTHDDADGILSAALMYEMFGERFYCETGFTYIAITDYPEIFSQDRKKRFKFKKTDTVCDLVQPKGKIMFWADHHNSGMKKNPKYPYIYDPKADSCAGLIYDRFQGDHPEIRKFESLVQDINIVDSAKYNSYEDIKDMGNDGVMLKLIMYGGKGSDYDKSYKTSLIRRISTAKSWKDLLRQPLQQQRATFALELMKEYEDYISSHMKSEGKVIVIDHKETKIPGKVNRFYPFSVFPNSGYQLSVHYGTNLCRIVISRNPFNDAGKNVDLSKIVCRMSRHSGGHDGIGVISKISAKKKEKTINSLLEILNES